MIVLSLINFHNDILVYNWYHEVEKIKLGTVYYIVNQKWITCLKDYEIDKFIFLPEESEKYLRTLYKDGAELQYETAYHEIGILKLFFKRQLEKLNKEQDINVVYSFCANQSLKSVCKENGYYFKFIEYSALRKSSYFITDLCWFLDEPVIHSKHEGIKRYKNFNKDKGRLYLKSAIPPLSILMLGGKEELLIYILKTHFAKSEYDIGVGLPGPRKETCGGWMPDRIIEFIEEKYKMKSVLYREHPGQNNLENFQRDFFASSLGFIGKCNTIISAGSNILFEAMMFKKEVIDFTDIFFADVIAKATDDSSKCVFDDWYINFLIFNAYVPLELLFDEKYVDWRKEEPAETDIFNYNFKFLCEKYFNVTSADFDTGNMEWEKTYNKRVNGIVSQRNDKLDILLNFSQVDWQNQRVIICGTGKDALQIMKIVENLGGKVHEFLITDGNKKYKKFAGINVAVWQEHQYVRSDVFIISQRNMIAQKDVLLILRKSGFENIICI